MASRLRLRAIASARVDLPLLDGPRMHAVPEIREIHLTIALFLECSALRRLRAGQREFILLLRLAAVAPLDRAVHGVDLAACLVAVALRLGAHVRHERAETHRRIGEVRL